MMREPWFWRSSSLTARVIAASLAPTAGLYDLVQRTVAKPSRPARAPAPVICIGAATLGGVGKTPFALMLHDLLKSEGVTAAFLTRGYGGREAGPLPVNPSVHDAIDVGDEALLLAQRGPTWVARDRAAGANAAAMAGASVLIMDDGYQNRSIEKTLSILLIDAADPAGNGHVFPAGPLREPMARAVARADIVAFVSNEPDAPPAPETQALAQNKPALRVWLETADAPAPQKVVAFCGVGAPRRFFDLLESLGFEVIEKYAFPDHHPYAPAHLERLRRQAARENAALITTEKDFARLPAHSRNGVLTLPVIMRADRPDMLRQRVLEAVAAARRDNGSPQ
ncbi:MAG: tetraacyldisaccharide 4'-kinase [Parvularculaceae bacterium]